MGHVCLAAYHVVFVLSIHYLHNPIIHLYYPTKLLHNHCLQFLLGHENAPREVENNAYADFWVVKEVYYGICASISQAKRSKLIGRFLVGILQYGPLPWKQSISVLIFFLFREVQVERNKKGEFNFFRHKSTIIASGI